MQRASAPLPKPLPALYGLSCNGNAHTEGKCRGAAAAKTLGVLPDEGCLGNMSPLRWGDVCGGGQAVVSPVLQDSLDALSLPAGLRGSSSSICAFMPKIEEY